MKKNNVRKMILSKFSFSVCMGKINYKVKLT